MSHLYDQQMRPSHAFQGPKAGLSDSAKFPKVTIETKGSDSDVDKHTNTSAVLHRDIHTPPLQVTSASGLYLTLSDGRKIIDATGGAAVSCIGHGDARVRDAIASQVTKLDYCHSLFFSCPPSEALARLLVDSTDGKMSKAFFVNSGE